MANKQQNRHLDILPNPRTRVILPTPTTASTGSSGDGHDANDPRETYINANYIRSSNGGNKKNFIAAMGPLKSTIPAFWRMIWAEEVAAVVMVTGLTEKGQSKCERYWPGQEGGSGLFPL